MIPIPILINHDVLSPIGRVVVADGKLVAEFSESARITREMFFGIFGSCALVPTDDFLERGVRYIRKAEILEYSLVPEPAVPKTDLRENAWRRTERKLKLAVGLLDSMVRSGESHTQTSEAVVREARDLSVP